MTPGPADCGTAELAGTDHALKLLRTLTVLRLPVAGPSPVVDLTVPPSEPVHTGTSVGPDTSPAIAAFLPADWLLTELSGVPRPAHTRVLSAGPAIEAGGGAASLRPDLTPVLRAPGGDLPVLADADVGFDTFSILTAVVITDWSKTETSESLHLPSRAAVTP